MLLWFESNGSHRHMRVALPDTALRAARRSLRAALDARRRAVSAPERRSAARRLARNLDRAVRLKPGMRVAIYASLPHELDSTPLMALAVRRGCRVYLPRIDAVRRGRRMRFIEMRGRLRPNRLGIGEPAGSALPARALDLVLLPLTGFDRHGVRLGSGGGYYDRAFAFRHWRHSWRGPRLVGVGYAFQEVAQLQAAPHDVLMDMVVTEQGIIRCATG